MMRWPRLNSLAPRDRRALALVAAAALAFVLLDFVVLPAVDSAANLRAAIPLKEKTLRKYQQMVALAGARETDWLAVQTRADAAEKRLLDSRTPALAGAEMQTLLKQLMSSAGIDMRSADFLPARPLKAGAATYTVAPIVVAFECPLDQLANLLAAAAGSSKILALDQLTVQHVQPRPDRPQKLVSVRMAIHGLSASESPK